MQPNVVFLRKICEAAQIIDGPAICRASIPNNRKNTVHHCAACSVRRHAPTGVRFNNDQFRIHHPRDSRDAAVCLAAAQKRCSWGD
jgi:hypothetical protein